MTRYLTQSYEYGFPLDWEGLDFYSADEATPRLYGVSTGNGNDGVSHIYPSYYVRTVDPWDLARAAMLSEFQEGEGQEWALDAMVVDGEAEYGIFATIYNPPDDGDGRDHSECEDGEDCGGCDRCGGDGTDYCSANGAWMIVEVFRESDPAGGRPTYDNLQEAFTPALLALAEES